MNEYVVRKGDTFEIIAKRCYEIYEANGNLDDELLKKVVSEIKRYNRDLQIDWSDLEAHPEGAAGNESVGRLVHLPLVCGVQIARKPRANWPYLAAWMLLVLLGVLAVAFFDIHSFDLLGQAMTGNSLIILLAFALLCSTVLPLVWLYNRPVTLAWTRARLRLAVFWGLGLLPLVPVSAVLTPILMNSNIIAQPPSNLLYASNLATLQILNLLIVTFAFLAAAWSVTMFIVFLLVGDGSNFYATYLYPHLGIWIAFSASLQVVLAGGYLVYPVAAAVNQTTMFLWTGILYVGVVSFPWVLLLMFVSRKRRNLAAQIVTDLRLLDPPANNQPKGESGLLKRILNRTNKQAILAEIDCHPDEPEYEDAVVRVLAEEAFNSIEYVFALLALTVLSALGWYYLLYPFGNNIVGWEQLLTLNDGKVGIGAVTTYLIQNVSPLTLGFAGAYLYVVQMLLRRYLSDDLYPAAFLQCVVRLIIVFILSLTLAVITQGLNDTKGQVITGGTISTIAFFIGIFPEWGLRLIGGLVAKKSGFMRPEGLDVKQPLASLDGINIWTESRLLEEGIENVQSMATAPIGQLVTHTHYTTAQIVDWVDQAILYIHCGLGPDPQWFNQFKFAGIRNATDLLDAVGLDLSRSKLVLTPRDFEPCDHNINQVVAAIAARRPVEVRTKVEGTTTPAGPTTQPAGADVQTNEGATPSAQAKSVPPFDNKAAESGKRSWLARLGNVSHQKEKAAEIPITPEVVRIICDTLWPDQNMQYVLNFYSQMKVIADSEQPDDDKQEYADASMAGALAAQVIQEPTESIYEGSPTSSSTTGCKPMYGDAQDAVDNQTDKHGATAVDNGKSKDE